LFFNGERNSSCPRLSVAKLAPELEGLLDLLRGDIVESCRASSISSEVTSLRVARA